MSVSIRSRTSSRDPVARAHRRAALFRTVLFLVLAAGIAGTVVWLMFSSSVFAVTDVQIAGASISVSTTLRGAIERVLGQRTLGFFRPARNILLLDEQSVAQSVRTAFANIENVQVRKRYPHTILVNVKERTPIGTWCIGDECTYFDAGGARWGSAVPSRGPLLLLVRDERQPAEWDGRIFAGLKLTVDELPKLGLRPVILTFPNTAPGDLTIRVDKAYDIYFDALGDVADQLSTLAVYLADKASDSTWKPVYIDLRTPGRIYAR